MPSCLGRGTRMLERSGQIEVDLDRTLPRRVASCTWELLFLALGVTMPLAEVPLKVRKVRLDPCCVLSLGATILL